MFVPHNRAGRADAAHHRGRFQAPQARMIDRAHLDRAEYKCFASV
jgi:hypothetical protein